MSLPWQREIRRRRRRGISSVFLLVSGIVENSEHDLNVVQLEVDDHDVRQRLVNCVLLDASNQVATKLLAGALDVCGLVEQLDTK